MGQESNHSLFQIITSPLTRLSNWYNRHDYYDKTVILAALGVFSLTGYKILKNWNVPRVTDLIIYPVKGCKGISFKKLDTSDRGFEYDRKWMIVEKELKDQNDSQDGTNSTDSKKIESYTFVTQRKFSFMTKLHTNLIDLPITENTPQSVSGKKGVLLWYVNKKGERIEYELKSLNTTNKISVEIWREKYPAFDEGDEVSEFLNQFFIDNEGDRNNLAKKEYRLVRSLEDASFARKSELVKDPAISSTVDFPDAFQYLLLSQQSINKFSEVTKKSLSFDRFRPNIVISGGIPPYDEEYWNEINIGKLKFYNGKTCTRCAVPTIDQNTGERDLEISALLRKYRGGRMDGREVTLFGINLSAAKGEKGSVKVGDYVWVKSRKPKDYVEADLS